MVKYSDKQKLAYYRRKAAMASARPKVMYPRRRYIRGRGDYVVEAKTRRGGFSAPKTFSGLGSAAAGAAGAAIGSYIAPGIGTAIGGTLGSQIGALGGQAVGKLFRKITGWGDYAIHNNTFVFPNQPIPEFEGSGSIRVVHKEYLGQVSGSTGFDLTSIALNPGLQTSFPWLSQIAQGFEQYRFNGMVFQFVSTSADALNSTNTALGQVAMATDYNAADDPYQNMPQLMGAYFSNVGKPSCDLLHAIECDPNQTPNQWYYIRGGDAPDNTDIRFYDLGNFQIATDGMQAVAQIGQLWVSYDVTLIKPQLNSPLGLNLQTDHFSLSSPSSASSFGAQAGWNPEEGSNIGCTLAANTCTFPPNLEQGRFFISYNATGSSTALIQPTLTLNSSCQAVPILQNGSSSRLGNGSTTSTNFTDKFVIDIIAPGASFTYSGGTLPGSATSGDLIIMQIPSDIE